MRPLTAAYILTITQPERLFTSPAAAQSERNDLAKQWHPDRNGDPQATDVLAHINRLYDEAERRIKDGTWQTPGLLELIGADGTKRRIRYRARHPFELGEFIYGDTILAYLVRREFADLFETGRKAIVGLKFRDDRMETEMRRFLPQLKTTFETKDGTCVMVLTKTPDVFLVRDVMAALGGKIDAKHVAWMQSALHNIVCYLEYANLSHNAITLDTYFVSPQMHSGLLLGGWWYATSFGSRLNALPTEAHAHTAPDVLRNKRADHRLDLTLVRAMGRTLLGDPTGMLLPGSKDAPSPMIEFLRRPSSGSAQADYEQWVSTVLPASFGKRRFVPLALTASDIFKENDNG